MSDGVLGLFSLRGKGAVVTGAARGLGNAMALALAEAGADIVAIDVESLAAVSDAVTDRGVRCATNELDLRALTPEDAADLIAWSRSRFEDISVLVNNAGMIRRAPAAETSAEDWHDVIGLNLTTPFFLAQAFARRLFRDGGRGASSTSCR